MRGLIFYLYLYIHRFTNTKKLTITLQLQRKCYGWKYYTENKSPIRGSPTYCMWNNQARITKAGAKKCPQNTRTATFQAKAARQEADFDVQGASKNRKTIEIIC